MTKKIASISIKKRLLFNAFFLKHFMQFYNWRYKDETNMIRINNRKICFLFLCIFFFAQNSAFAQDACLTDIIVSNTRDDLLIYLNVEGAFKEKMKKAILSGVPATFSFIINLNLVRNLWLDNKIVDLKVTNTIKFNNLKNEFIVTRPWRHNKPFVTRSFKEAMHLMTEIDSLKIISLDQLEKGKQYQIRAFAKLNKLTLPFYLHYVLFFVSLLDFETDWYTIDFIY